MPVSTKSAFVVEVVRVLEIHPHPNADRLEIVKVHGTTPVVVRKGDFRAGDLAVYIPVDAIVPLEHPVFSFLKSNRIKAARLRGVYSEGLLVPVSAFPEQGAPFWVEGTPLTETLGITRRLSQEDLAEQRVSLYGTNRGVPRYSNPREMPVYGLDALLGEG